ncbi:LINE-1 type transposase domain-containing protein 1 [Cricetulus griseus]|uniref:LINE-1 type transposase domain-containing protein 1 n=1 Tax=Cricetulus griseus TaxID=10029 RepID=A0A061IGP3_CRIGR|nr:LINE-1 type transposase domain-containing protein 1 [Cricetulus griseus]
MPSSLLSFDLKLIVAGQIYFGMIGSAENLALRIKSYSLGKASQFQDVEFINSDLSDCAIFKFRKQSPVRIHSLVTPTLSSKRSSVAGFILRPLILMDTGFLCVALEPILALVLAEAVTRLPLPSRIFCLLKEKELEPELQCSAKLAFKCDGEAKTFSDLYSLWQFTTTKPFLKELLKDVLPENEARNGLQERLGKTLGDTKHEARRIARDSLSFLFINEVKVASPNMKTYEEETLEQKVKEALKLERQESSGAEEGKETSEGEASEMGEEEDSELEEEEGSELGEEEEEDSELGEEEETSEEEEEEEEEEKEEEASVLHETQGSTFQGLTVVQELGVEKITWSNEIGLISLIVDSETEKAKGNLKKYSQTKKRETFHGLRELVFSYLVWDSKRKKLVKCQEGGAAAMTRVMQLCIAQFS